MDKKIIEIARKYAELVKDITDVKTVVLYGSAARGEMKEYSDIDVAVIVDDLKGDYLELSAKLFELVRKVDIRIEPNLLIRKFNKSGFIETVLKEGEVIYAA
ncbi:MAG: nucleotidyltransferase domain-containing protein [Bacteroidetes bacterium]|nr:nucleotidyltransferase domain-containing protein [Bacteroidota bacterium]